ncbi:Probable NADH dehydrogenase [ubiquinone] 1 beta s ubcomplex subunit 2, mitochondrial [Trichuris trichiura]|uniref:Probable NADH dehydrogenase [ubiquinone] 1 beta s ubcomplex subunit 2, mitochondrial n=1 Tax=Trichuris trichiura TaxID=36087 RepID=A0A077ZGW1_TRITR|nr:Probable NADH dehydrogenase [ubiquinone] 1 beta s ubcomplex subunit 2, mitochondrial [Trichuris trichiura]
MVIIKLVSVWKRIGSRSFCKRAAEFKGMVNYGPREHPVFWKGPPEWLAEGEKYPFAYRTGYAGEPHKFDRLVTKYYISGLFWGYMLYRLYYDYMEVIGEPEWPLPRLEQFTDEELGIPDDDSVAPRLYGAAVV